MDIVFIERLRADAVIGIFDFEKSQTQPLYFDIEMATNIAVAAASDKIDDALDYAAVSARVRDLATNNKAELLETLIENIAATLLTEFAIDGIKIKLHKPEAVPEAQSVGVMIARGAAF